MLKHRRLSLSPVIPLALAMLLGSPPAVTAQGDTAAVKATKPATAERIPVLLVTGANNHDWRWTAPCTR